MLPEQGGVTFHGPAQPGPVPHQRAAHPLARGRAEGAVGQQPCALGSPLLLGHPCLEQPRLDLHGQRSVVEVGDRTAEDGQRSAYVSDHPPCERRHDHGLDHGVLGHGGEQRHRPVGLA